MAEDRASQIKAKEAAIKRRLADKASTAKASATAAAKKNPGKAQKYSTQAIDKSRGYAPSDYGVGAGAGIPYQLRESTKTVKHTKSKNREPKPKTGFKSGKPTAKKPKGHVKYKVKRGDTLSSIAKRYGTTVDKIWNYNLKNRSKKTQSTLRKRGKNLIFRGGTFYIPR